MLKKSTPAESTTSSAAATIAAALPLESAIAIAAVLTCAAFALTGCSSGNASGANGASGADSASTPEASSASEGATETETPTPCTFTDDLGNEVTVSNPQRVVACMGSFANTWELAGGTLVGASDDTFTFENFEIASPNVQKVGDFSSINLEAIIALEPDFVIMTCGTGGRGGDSSQADLKEALDASGIPVAYFEVTTFDDYLRMLDIFCEITGRDDLYQQNGADIKAAIDAIVADAAQNNAPTALLMATYSSGTRVQTSSSMTGDMLSDLGVTNLADENRSLLSDFNLESIIELDPDYLFVIPMGNDAEAALKSLEDATAANPAWATLSAVQEGRYLTLDPNLFLYKPNSNWAQAYQELFDALYGQN